MVTDLDEGVTDRIDGVFREWDRRDSPGCALGVYRDGELIHARGFGMANLEHGAPIRPDSIFHVASISKQFTSLCVALLEQDGALSLDDDIRALVPEIPDYGHTITIRHLIHHISGLRDQWDLLRLAGWREDDVITEGDVLEIAPRQTALNFPPGDQYLYSNTAYTLLAVIVRRASGKSLREFAAERVFRPLGMTRTHFHDDHREIVPGRTQAYVPGDDPKTYRISIPVFDLSGTTSLFTTVEDMARWDANFEHGTVGGDLLELRQTPARLNDGTSSSYGLGLRVGAHRGLEIVEHSGSDAGYRAHYVRVPSERLGVAVFANLSTIRPNRLAYAVLEAILGERMDPEEAPIELPEDQLARWTGIYRSPRTGNVQRVTLENGTLTLPLLDSTPLLPLDEHRFLLGPWRAGAVAFSETDGQVAMELRGGIEDRFEWVTDTPLDDIRLRDYVGFYTSDELGTEYTFTIEDGTLSWQRRKFSDTPLQSVLPDTFTHGGARFDFTRDATGTVDGFTVNTWRVRGVRFHRRGPSTTDQR